MGRKGKGGNGRSREWGRKSAAPAAQPLPVQAVELEARPFAPPSRFLLYALAATQDVRERTVYVDGSKADPSEKMQESCGRVEREEIGLGMWRVTVESKEGAAKAVRELSSKSWRGMRLSFAGGTGLLIGKGGSSEKKEQQQQQQQKGEQIQQRQGKDFELTPLPQGRFEGVVCTLRQSFGYLKAMVKGYGRANRDSRFYFPAGEVASLYVFRVVAVYLPECERVN